MKRKSLFLRSSVLLFTLGALAGCGGGADTQPDPKTVIIWVGEESVEYYRGLADKYIAQNPDFGYEISVIGTDIGSNGGAMVKDNTACGDIVTIAHDNIGKLSQLAYILPIIDEDTLAQINADNPDTFKEAVRNQLSDDEDHTYTFGAPCISQALFLYYDTRYVKDEEADSFEGLITAAKRYDTEHSVSKTHSYVLTGDDGFNFSFPLLYRNLTKNNSTDLRLYVNGEGKDNDGIKNDCYAQANEEVAVMKWMQRNYADPNGGYFSNAASPWETMIEQHSALSVIGGAWHYNSFKKSVTDGSGKVHMGCKTIPTFELKDVDVQGITSVTYPNDSGLPENLRGKTDPAPTAGTIMKGGSFVDCKCFVLNAATAAKPSRYYKLCKLIKYLSSKDAQNGSYLEAFNVPAYAGANVFIEQTKDQVKDKEVYLMASAQTGMNSYGIPQPFVTGALNTFFYSKNAPSYYVQCVKNQDNAFSKVDDIRKVLYRMEYIWKHGKDPKNFPTEYPAETTKINK